MPHDANGKLIGPGDKVVIPATVVSVHEGLEFYNCAVELGHIMPGASAKDVFSALNTRQLERIEITSDLLLNGGAGISISLEGAPAGTTVDYRGANGEVLCIKVPDDGLPVGPE